MALALWADPHGQALDRWTHLSGFGWLLVRVSISLGASLHAVAVCLGIGQWDRRRQLMWVHVGLLVPMYLFSFLLAIVMFAIVYLRGAVVKPLLRWWDAMARAQHQLAEMRAAAADALDVNSQVDDKLVLMTSYADPDIMRETKRACTERDVTYDERLAVVAAAMLVTLRPENIDRRRQKGDQQLDSEVRREGLHHLAELSSTDAFFFSDAYMVAALACGVEELGIPLPSRSM